MSDATLNAVVDRVVDGDTIKVAIDGAGGALETLRVLALDTEEVFPGTKPVTRLGRLASEFARSLIGPGDALRLILPGIEPPETALLKYRGNYGRLLCYVELASGDDFQEVMIREGYSPYFMKYGYAHFAERHARYIAAERDAQAARRGVWDQIENNGAERRNYAALGVWWDLRARVIEGFREIKRRAPEANLYNTRLDYERLVAIAAARQDTTVFMELRSFTRTSADHVIFDTGSLTQPYQLFVPNGALQDGEEIMNLLLSRYVAEGEERPRRSYAYVTGPTKIFPDNQTGRPEIVVTDPAQITDWPSAALDRALSSLVSTM